MASLLFRFLTPFPHRVYLEDQCKHRLNVGHRVDTDRSPVQTHQKIFLILKFF